MIDDFSRECLAAVVDTSLSGDKVVPDLDLVAEMRGYPSRKVRDNGTELTSNAILKWQGDRKVDKDLCMIESIYFGLDIEFVLLVGFVVLKWFYLRPRVDFARWRP